MNSQPFSHRQIPNSLGLFAITDTNNNTTASFHCTLCSKHYPTHPNYEYAKRNFVRHAKSNSHLMAIQVMSIIPDPDTSLPPNNETTFSTNDDATNQFTFPGNDDSSNTTEDISYHNLDSTSLVHTNTERNVSIIITDSLKDLFGANTSNYLYYAHECQNERSGFKAILSKCLLNNSKLYDVVKDYDVILHFNLLKVLSSLSQNQRSKHLFINCNKS
jgi:hypothetical protein